MIVKSLHINDFSGTKNRSVELAPGFNVIEGPNESGKTTLASFIKFIMYGFDDKAERVRHISWGSGSASGSMVVVGDDGKEYRIERTCTEAGRDRAVVVDLAAGSPCFEGRDPADVFLGVPSEIFCHTAFIGQAAGGDVDGEKVSRAIENILFSADEAVNTEKAAKKLDEARVMLYYKSHKGGRIYDLIHRRDDLRVRLENAKNSNIGLIELEGGVRETKEQLGKARENLVRATKRLEKADAANKYRGLSRLRELSENAERAGAEYEELCRNDSFDGFLPDASYVAELERCKRDEEAATAALIAAQDELDAHNARSGDLEAAQSFAEKLESLGGADEVSDRMERSVARQKGLKKFAITVFILAALFAGAAAAAYFIDLSGVKFLPEKPLPTLICGIAALIFTVCGITGVIVRSRSRMEINEMLCDLDVDSGVELEKRLLMLNFDETRIRLHNSQAQEYQERIADLVDRRSAVATRAEDLLGRWGKTDLTAAAEDAMRSVERRAELKTELDKYVMARDTLAAQLGVGDPAAALDALGFDPESDGDIAPEALDDLRREYDFYMKQTDALSEKLHGLEKQFAVVDATVESAGELAEKIAVTTDEINDLSRKHHALVMAYDELEAAAKDLRESVSPRLAESAGQIMSSLTSGKYDRLGVGHSLELAYDADAQTHGIEYMSAGTRDAAYLSLRFALIDLLYGDKTPPLIFDESFSRLDDSRYGCVLAVISEMADRGAQTLLFTSQTRDARMASEQVPDCRRIAL